MLNDPESMAKTMPGVESFDVHDPAALDREREDPARPRRPADEDRHGEGRGARARVREARDQGQGRRRDAEHGDAVRALRRARRRHRDALDRRRPDRRPGRLDGSARPAADRQPAGSARPDRARPRGAGRGLRSRHDAAPFRVGVMQLTMEPLDEMLASARAMDAAGMDTIWLAEAYPWWRKHGMEARSSTVVSALMARETKQADDRLGDHLAVHAPSRAGRDGRARRAGGGRPRAVHPRLRHVEDLPQQRADADVEDARPDARRGRRSCAACSAASAFDYDGDRPGAPTFLRCRPRRTRRATCRRSTSRRRRRRCRRSPARSATAA